jgi:hypothetical protein
VLLLAIPGIRKVNASYDFPERFRVKTFPQLLNSRQDEGYRDLNYSAPA